MYCYNNPEYGYPQSKWRTRLFSRSLFTSSDVSNTVLRLAKLWRTWKFYESPRDGMHLWNWFWLKEKFLINIILLFIITSKYFTNFIINLLHCLFLLRGKCDIGVQLTMLFVVLKPLISFNLKFSSTLVIFIINLFIIDFEYQIFLVHALNLFT